ncbi:MAG: hypothetical protein RLO04_01530 [Limnobacter sp.]|uniref:MBL fold metallo-hydrolase n=1 Tax=Limnobacter sp. TaxID=2003368 RepID=UPI0032EF6B70
MRLLRISLTVLTCTVLIAVGALVFLLQTHPDFSITERPAQPTDKAVRMLFLGTSSMAWTDGQSTWLVDGFFSRQPVGEVLLSRLKVEEGRVLEVLDEVFRRLEIPAALSGIVVAHSHYDHSLDAPFLAMQFGARLYGSQSTWQIAQGQNLPAMQMEVMQQGGVASLGQFELKLVLSAHAPTGFTGGFNTQPLPLPARALSFKEGLSYSFVVSHPALGPAPFALIQPSAGFLPGQNKGLTVNTVFLGTGGLGKLDEQYMADYWQEMVVSTRAKKVYLIHWDDFTQPLLAQGKPVALKPMPRLLDDFPRSLELLKMFSKRDEVDLQVLNAWEIIYF